ncbi:MAG: lytic transglycosylase domain-containing protein [Flavobacteriales bacterium]|nr:lytic transglycosylase domain-containing protein [Flavobacteriales bacterium]MCB9194469.1 lytic transglycosylase domain-containing protein [Flavobacteriales bacterium]
MRNDQNPIRTLAGPGRTLGALLFLAFMTVALRLFTYSVSDEETDLDHQRDFNANYKIFSLTLPNQVSLCGETVPMDKLDVRERLDRELLVNTYWQSNSILAYKRSARWFPVISEVLRREGLPDDLKYIPLVESGLTNVVSPAGATGYWQFMKETAEHWGLEVNGEVDERYNVVKSTEAACRYLKDQYAHFGSWALAVAAYNLGPAGVDKQIARQKQEDYYQLLLPEETSRYVFRLLALKEITSDPERYGFHIRDKDLYRPYRVREMVIDGRVDDLADLAIRQGTDYKTLKLLNPWLRDTKLSNPQGHTYQLLLPAADFDEASGADDR